MQNSTICILSHPRRFSNSIKDLSTYRKKPAVVGKMIVILLHYGDMVECRTVNDATLLPPFIIENHVILGSVVIIVGVISTSLLSTAVRNHSKNCYKPILRFVVVTSLATTANGQEASQRAKKNEAIQVQSSARNKMIHKKTLEEM